MAPPFQVLNVDPPFSSPVPRPRGVRLPHLNLPWAPTPEDFFWLELVPNSRFCTSRSMLEAMGLFCQDLGKCEVPWVMPRHRHLLRNKWDIPESGDEMEDLHSRVNGLRLHALEKSCRFGHLLRSIPTLLEQKIHNPDEEPRVVSLHGNRFLHAELIQVIEWKQRAVSSIESLSKLLRWSEHRAPAYVQPPFNFLGVRKVQSFREVDLEAGFGKRLLLVCTFAVHPVLAVLKAILAPLVAPGEFVMKVDKWGDSVRICYEKKIEDGKEVESRVLAVGGVPREEPVKLKDDAKPESVELLGETMLLQHFIQTIHEEMAATGARVGFYSSYAHWIFLFACPAKDHTWFPRHSSAEQHARDRLYFSRPIWVEKRSSHPHLPTQPVDSALRTLLHALLLAFIQTCPDDFIIPAGDLTWDQLNQTVCAGFPEEWALQAKPRVPLSEREDAKMKDPAVDIVRITSVPKLEEHIPYDDLPHILIVHDPDNLTGESDPSVSTFKYILSKKPTTSQTEAVFMSAPDPRRVAHLYLSKEHPVGGGHSSSVWRGELEVFGKEGEDGVYEGGQRATVIAKITNRASHALEHMSNEARMYSMFPDHLFQDWAGYVIIPPMMQPHALQPVVPNFYGHYFPEDIPDEAQDSLTSSARERARDHVLGQIMLLEDCGRNVQPAELSRRQKEECWSLLCRLHYAGFTQGSMYQRNVMIQPGPLSIPPERRSMATPSYRIIDFGRARAAADCSESDLQERKKQDQDGAGELLDIHCAFVSSSRIPNPGDYVPKPPPVIPLQPAPLD